MRLFIVLLTFFIALHANASSSVHKTKSGSVYVGGKGASKQIFIKENSTVHQLSEFKAWENINTLYISPDQNYLVAYHKANKGKSYLITLYDLNKRIKLAETAPGMACFNIKWFKDKILFFTGSSGSGTYIYGYDYKFRKQYEINGWGMEVDVDAGIYLSYPVYSADDGIFIIYDLNNGKEKLRFDFKRQIDEDYVCNNISKVAKNTYKFKLFIFETKRNLDFIRTFENDYTSIKHN